MTQQLRLFYLLACFIIFSTTYIYAELAPDQYKVGVNDLLEIKVLDQKELQGQFVVTSDGTITFPYIGIVNVKDKNISDIKEEITNKLSEGYIKYPIVSVSLIKSGKIIITFGELGHSGEIPFQENMTVMTGLSLAGGASENGLYGKLRVRRKVAGVFKDIAESELSFGAIVKKDVENVLLKPDDMLIVERNKTFLIQGEVATRGRYPLEKDMTVLRALSQAGGVTENGLYGKIRVRRTSDGAHEGYSDFMESKLSEGIILSKDVENALLQPNDILIVEKSRTFLIQGEVATRGRYALEKDMTVLRALLQAGGVTPEGLQGKVKIRRKNTGASEKYIDFAESALDFGNIMNKEVEDTILMPEDVLIVEKNKTFLIQGEVVQRGRITLEKDMTVLKAILQVGGVTADGLYGTVKVRRKQEGVPLGYTNLVEAKLNYGVIESPEVENTLLEPDDIIVVERNGTFFVYGEVNTPGEFVLKGDMTVFNAMSIAGGLNKWGSESKVKILRVKDGNTEGSNRSRFEEIKVDIKDVIKGDASKDVLLKSKDIIVVSAGIF